MGVSFFHYKASCWFRYGTNEDKGNVRNEMSPIPLQMAGLWLCIMDMWKTIHACASDKAQFKTRVVYVFIT